MSAFERTLKYHLVSYVGLRPVMWTTLITLPGTDDEDNSDCSEQLGFDTALSAQTELFAATVTPNILCLPVVMKFMIRG